MDESGRRIVVRNWAQNLSHAQTLRTDLRLNPLSGHEIVAKKRVPNPDRVFGENVEVSVAFLYCDGRLAFLLSPLRGKQSWGEWEVWWRLVGLGDIPGKMKCGEQCWPQPACHARKHHHSQRCDFHYCFSELCFKNHSHTELYHGGHLCAVVSAHL